MALAAFVCAHDLFAQTDINPTNVFYISNSMFKFDDTNDEEFLQVINRTTRVDKYLYMNFPLDLSTATTAMCSTNRASVINYGVALFGWADMTQVFRVSGYTAISPPPVLKQTYLHAHCHRMPLETYSACITSACLAVGVVPTYDCKRMTVSFAMRRTEEDEDK